MSTEERPLTAEVRLQIVKDLAVEFQDAEDDDTACLLAIVALSLESGAAGRATLRLMHGAAHAAADHIVSRRKPLRPGPLAETLDGAYRALLANLRRHRRPDGCRSGK